MTKWLVAARFLQSAEQIPSLCAQAELSSNCLLVFLYGLVSSPFASPRASAREIVLHLPVELHLSYLTHRYAVCISTLYRTLDGTYPSLMAPDLLHALQDHDKVVVAGPAIP